MTLNALDALLNADTSFETDVFIPRLGVAFRVKAATNDILEQADERATFGDKRDAKEFTNQVVSMCVISPDLSDKRLLEKYGATTPGEVLNKALLPAEVQLVTDAIYASTFTDVNEVKN